MEWLKSLIPSVDIVAIMAALIGLGATIREKIIQSELQNFDFWIRDRAKNLLDDVGKLCEKYENNPSDTINTSTLLTISDFSRRSRDRYYGVLTGHREIYWKTLDISTDTSFKDEMKKLDEACNSLDESVKTLSSPEDVAEKCLRLEFQLSEFVSHIRRRITYGKGIFCFFVFRKLYSRR